MLLGQFPPTTTLPMRTLSALTLLVIVLGSGAARAQTIQPPDRVLLERAKGIVADSIFARLEAGQADELAEWVTDATHSEASGVTRLQQFNQFQTQFRMMTEEATNSPFGKMEGYDLLQEVALPGTDRYFRLTYMSYHQELPLVWEIHFYVRPDRTLSIPYLQFNGQNPFTYLSTPDMLIERYYNAY